MSKVWYLVGSYDWGYGEVLGLYATEKVCRKAFEDYLSKWCPKEWCEGKDDTDSQGKSFEECVETMHYEDWDGNVYLIGGQDDVQSSYKYRDEYRTKSGIRWRTHGYD